MDTIPKLLLHHAREHGNKAAIREKEFGIWQTYTWAASYDNVRAMALGLAALGFQRGDKLAIIGDHRPQLYWGFAAAQALGGVPVPLYRTRSRVRSSTLSSIRKRALCWPRSK